VRVIALVALLALATAVTARAACHASSATTVAARLGRRPSRALGRDDSVQRVVERVLRGHRDRQLESALPNALDGVARSLRSGASLRQAMVDAARDEHGPLAVDLRRLARDVDDGVSLGDALAEWAQRRPLTGVRLAAAALALGAETGGASAQAIDGVAATLRINLGIAGEVRALSSQARLSALVIVLAPVAFTALATSTDDRTAGFLFGSAFGWLCLTLGLALDAVGWLWMRRITNVPA
jgi:tight adherence protein B